jgi:uncharacterized protein YbcI
VSTLPTREDFVVDSPSGQGMRAAISSTMVRLKKEFYGRGPTKAKTYFNDNYVFCVMEGGLTRNEETLLDAGQEDIVRDFRLNFQEVVTDVCTGAIEAITGRKVLTYHSQILFRPERIFEIFVLDAPAQEADPRDGR